MNTVYIKHHYQAITAVHKWLNANKENINPQQMHLIRRIIEYLQRSKTSLQRFAVFRWAWMSKGVSGGELRMFLKRMMTNERKIHKSWTIVACQKKTLCTD